MQKSQEVLTAASKKRKKKTQIDKRWEQYQKRFIKLVKSTSEIEHLNLDNVLKSTIFTVSEFQAFMTRSLKKFALVCETARFYIIWTCDCEFKVQVQEIVHCHINNTEYNFITEY